MKEENRLILKPVSQEDCRRVWEWANDPDVRKLSFSSEPITWEAHVKWFNGKLDDPQCIMYIAWDARERPVGQIRYDRTNTKEAIISIIIDKNYRDRGYGTNLILLGSQKVLAIGDINLLHAYLKPTNHASQRAFIKAGFEEMEISTVRGHSAIHLVKAK
jgi:UDP-2,4-diacetamido-2,4,6-trideoxy-beta-L-altropyranose hydrolase